VTENNIKVCVRDNVKQIVRLLCLAVGTKCLPVHLDTSCLTLF